MGRMCGLSTVVTPAGASLTMYREIRSYANSIWDDNNNKVSCNQDYRACLLCLYGLVPCMGINVIVQHNGGFLSDTILLLTQAPMIVVAQRYLVTL